MEYDGIFGNDEEGNWWLVSLYKEGIFRCEWTLIFYRFFQIFNVLFFMKLVNEIQNRWNRIWNYESKWEFMVWDAVKIFTLPCNSFFQVFLILNKFKYIVNVILQNEKYKKLKLCTISNINFSKISNFLLRPEMKGLKMVLPVQNKHRRTTKEGRLRRRMNSMLRVSYL